MKPVLLTGIALGQRHRTKEVKNIIVVIKGGFWVLHKCFASTRCLQVKDMSIQTGTLQATNYYLWLIYGFALWETPLVLAVHRFFQWSSRHCFLLLSLSFHSRAESNLFNWHLFNFFSATYQGWKWHAMGALISSLFY